jgi:hypothetical protein
MSHQRRYAMLRIRPMHDQESGGTLLVRADASQEKVLQCLSKKTRWDDSGPLLEWVFISSLSPWTVDHFFSCQQFASTTLTPSVKTLPSLIARRTLLMSRERSWGRSSTSTIGEKEIFPSRQSVLTARRLAGPPNAWLVSFTQSYLRIEPNSLFHLRIPLWVVWIHFSWRMPSLRLARLHVWHSPAHLLATTRCVDSSNWSANGSNNRSSD